ncbi:iron-hydroxamate ABC transporter substrate-binding protein [Shouchella sp. 1P09AA]|uniref:iron-hydroxamate ABC transporter substrate-binding protein n=1 Tax=unclassified Shouchella TaxID=2893065 RepID=UPI00399FEE05
MKTYTMLPLAAMAILATAACNTESGSQETNDSNDSETFTYESEKGPIEVPTNPERIVALSSAPNLLSLDVPLVGVDEWTYGHPLFTEELEEAETQVVSDENLESIVELQPDLIIVGAHANNIDRLEEVAPTIVYTWGELDYLTQHVELGKLVDKEEEAQAWVDDYSDRAAQLGDDIRSEIGEETTVSVFEVENEDFYTFNDGFARGTELLYQAMDLEMPEEVAEDVAESGYYQMSTEVIGDYAGDFIVLSRRAQADTSFMESDTWNNIPAVQNDRVIEIDMESSTYSDPRTLDHLMEVFEDGFLK